MLEQDLFWEEAYPVAASVIDPSRSSVPHRTDKPPCTVNSAANNKCEGCQNKRHRTDPTHDRTLERCKWPWHPGFLPSCDACRHRKDRSDPNHSKDDGCRWSQQFIDWMKELQASVSRLTPHMPGPKPHEDDTAGLPASSGGVELGAQGERDVTRAIATGCPVGLEFRASDTVILREERNAYTFLSPRAQQEISGLSFLGVTNASLQICEPVKIYVLSMVFGFSLLRISTGISPMRLETRVPSFSLDSHPPIFHPSMIFPLFLVFRAETRRKHTPVLALSGRHLLALVRLLPHRAQQVPPRMLPHGVAVASDPPIVPTPRLIRRRWTPILRIGEISALEMLSVCFVQALRTLFDSHFASCMFVGGMPVLVRCKPF